MGSRDVTERYNELIRHQRRVLEEFAVKEIGYANDLLWLYRAKNLEIPNDEYRAVAYFKNREFLRKPGSLTLLYQMYWRCMAELPEPTRENSFDLLGYRYMVYARTLKEGGYDV
ncbi:hypothetical protein AGMMS49928_28790 [Spirochaetia bacterium]|nr:hypothetical protein AGMMS49928_28790 [Spirochaetia bacterium]